jgi:sugar O-acyltransferase (sialic acid O-acetyltransferase NeuD family)
MNYKSITQSLLIFGAGGFGKEILDILNSSVSYSAAQISFIDDSFTPDILVNDISVIGGIDTVKNNLNSQLIIALGSPTSRRKLALKLKEIGSSFFTAIDASANVRPNVTIGEGSIVCANVAISTNSQIGTQNIINIGAIVGHDVITGNYSVFSPGSIVLGGVTIGEGVEVGAGAIVHPGVKIGNWCKIAMGAVLYKDVPDYAIVSGNPARVMIVQPEDWYLQ